MGSGVRALFGAVLFVGVLRFLLVGMLANSATRTSMTVVTVPSAERVKTWQFTGKERQRFHLNMDLNYMSKRRVPNGPDPIHNRRAEKSRRPPGT